LSDGRRFIWRLAKKVRVVDSCFIQHAFYRNSAELFFLHLVTILIYGRFIIDCRPFHLILFIRLSAFIFVYISN
jgi:hypothetical protein